MCAHLLQTEPALIHSRSHRLRQRGCNPGLDGPAADGEQAAAGAEPALADGLAWPSCQHCGGWIGRVAGRKAAPAGLQGDTMPWHSVDGALRWKGAGSRAGLRFPGKSNRSLLIISQTSNSWWQIQSQYIDHHICHTIIFVVHVRLVPCLLCCEPATATDF